MLWKAKIQETEHLLQILQELDNGKFLQELAARMRDVMEAVVEETEKGSVACTFKMAPTSALGVNLTYEFTHKSPRAPNATVVYMTTDGIVEHDPRQISLIDSGVQQ